jgi:uncharacterized protein
MLSIKEKLSKYHTKSSGSPRSKETDASVVQGEIVNTSYGSYILRYKSFPLKFDHGADLQQFLRFNARDWMLLGKNRVLHKLTPHNIVVVDTETTGLAGGTGTLAFMIGIGEIEGDNIVIRQYFMRDFSDEPAVLQAISEHIGDKTAVVSYNGKAYDFSVLRSRYILNRKSYPFEKHLHLDFLHTARRLWKGLVKQCTLQNLELNILRLQRRDDIPGWEIPQLYFDYLKSGDLKSVLPIFQHNCIDILSLFSLLIRARYCFMPGGKVYPVYQGVIKTLHDLGFYRKADFVFDRILAQAPEHSRAELYFEKSMNLKKIGNWARAVAIWNQLVDEHQTDPRVYTELAKYYEHKNGKINKALQMVVRLEKRLEILAELYDEDSLAVSREELLYRKQRLLRKEKKAGDNETLSP